MGARIIGVPFRQILGGIEACPRRGGAAGCDCRRRRNWRRLSDPSPHPTRPRMKISFADSTLPKSGAVVVGVGEERKLGGAAARLDKETGGALARAMAASRFVGKKDELLPVLAPANLPFSRVVLAGMGKSEAVDATQMQNLGGAVVAHLNQAGEKAGAILLDAAKGPALSPAEAAANVAFGARLRSYRFDKYRTKQKPEQKPSLERLTIHGNDGGAAKKRWQGLEKVAEGVLFTRDLVSE